MSRTWTVHLIAVTALSLGCSSVLLDHDENAISEAASNPAITDSETQESGGAAAHLTDEDQRVLDVVVSDLFTYEDFHPSVVSGTFQWFKPTDILVHHSTPGADWGSENIAYGLSEVEGQTIPFDIVEDVRERNIEEVSLANYKPTDPKILVRNLDPIFANPQFRAFENSFPSAKGYVHTFLPGYSRDGNRAAVRFWIGPIRHPTWVTYMLAQEEEHWTVKWRNINWLP